MQSVRGNIKYMNIAKALGILAVVASHAISPNVLGIPYSFYHVALFFFIAGYFYKDHYSVQPLEFIAKRLKRLYIPFVVFQIIFILLHNFFLEIHFYADKPLDGWPTGYGFNWTYPNYDFNGIKHSILLTLTLQNTEPLADAFWFIISLITISIMFSVMSYLIFSVIKPRNGEWIRGVFVAFCFIMSFVLLKNGVTLIRYFNTSLIVLTLYYLGYLYKRHEPQIIFNRYLATIVLALLWINAKYGKSSLPDNSYSSPAFMLFATLSGIYVILYISKVLASKKNTLWLEYIGKNSMSIMLFHLLSFKLVTIAIAYIYKLPPHALSYQFHRIGYWWIVYILVGTGVPLMLNYIYQKIAKRLFSAIQKNKEIKGLYQ